MLMEPAHWLPGEQGRDLKLAEGRGGNEASQKQAACVWRNLAATLERSTLRTLGVPFWRPGGRVMV